MDWRERQLRALSAGPGEKTRAVCLGEEFVGSIAQRRSSGASVNGTAEPSVLDGTAAADDRGTGLVQICVGRLDGFKGPARVVSRTGHIDDLCYEAFCNPRDGQTVLDAIWEAVQDFGIVPFCLDALAKQRVDTGLAFVGREFDDAINPIEAGIGFTAPYKTQNADFTGRTAWTERKSHKTRCLAGLHIEGAWFRQLKTASGWERRRLG